MGEIVKVYEYVKKYLPSTVSNALDNLSKAQQEGLTEIRIRRNMPVVFVINSRTCFVDNRNVSFSVPEKNVLTVTSTDFEDMFNRLCSYSVYSNMNNLKNGYITLENGSRVGVCSSAVYEDEKHVSVKNISSVNIRIPRQAVGCSREVLNKIFANGVCSVIVAGKPSGGKTTLLRDMARELSDGFNNEYKKVAIVDERNELAGKVGNDFTLDVGLNTDVITGFEKAKGIENAIRTMSPDVIVCDEIATQKEFDKIRFGFSCGVKFLLSIHIGKKQELFVKPILSDLLSTGEFEKIVLLDENYSVKILDAREIFNEICRSGNNHNFVADDGNIFDRKH